MISQDALEFMQCVSIQSIVSVALKQRLRDGPRAQLVQIFNDVLNPLQAPSPLVISKLSINNVKSKDYMYKN